MCIKSLSSCEVILRTSLNLENEMYNLKKSVLIVVISLITYEKNFISSISVGGMGSSVSLVGQAAVQPQV